MDPIPGLDLHKLNEEATGLFQKAARTRVVDHLRGIMLQAHNLQMKAHRLRMEADQADESRRVIEKKIKGFQGGDWSVLDPLDIPDSK